MSWNWYILYCNDIVRVRVRVAVSVQCMHMYPPVCVMNIPVLEMETQLEHGVCYVMNIRNRAEIQISSGNVRATDEWWVAKLGQWKTDTTSRHTLLFLLLLLLLCHILGSLFQLWFGSSSVLFFCFRHTKQSISNGDIHQNLCMCIVCRAPIHPDRFSLCSSFQRFSVLIVHKIMVWSYDELHNNSNML